MTTYADSGPLGIQTPRILLSPERVQSVGRAAVDLAALAGLILDPWQELVLEHALGEKDEWYFNDVLQKRQRKFSAFEVGLVVPRQNGKGSILEALELAGLFLLGERTILHSAHEFATSKEAFQRVEALVSGTPELRAEVRKIAWSHGDEGITLKNGQRLLFKTRTKGAARGFTIDRLILDEAMILKREMVAAMMPAMSARPNPQIWYTGSAGNKESEHFGRARARALAGSDPRLCFLEWSIDWHTDMCPIGCEDHDEVYDPISYAKANPGLGIRLGIENIESERRSMDPEIFARERLSVGDWPVEGDAWRVISKEAWYARASDVSAPQSPLVFSVDVPPDRRYGCIAVAGYNGESTDDIQHIHMEVTNDGTNRYDYRSGTSWIVERLLQLCKQHRPSAVVIDKSQQAGSFVDELEGPLEKLKIEMLHPTLREYAQACGSFYSSIVPRKGNVPCLVHVDQSVLTSAVAGAEKRDLSDMWAWNKRSASVDISPLVACTNAVWGLQKMATIPKPSPPWAAYS